jgi:hypothetical protein
MAFDLAIGVSANELNTASQTFYTELYPSLFTGEQNNTYKGIAYTVNWDVKNAPVFNLSASADSAVRVAALQRRAQSYKKEESLTAVKNLSALAGAAPSFQVNFPLVNVTLGGGITVTLPLPLTADCTIAISGNTLSFEVNQVTTPPITDPVQNYLVQNIVVPQILAIAQSLLGGITIPPLSVSGINLSVPSVGIVNNCIIAAANLQASGTPPPPDGSIPWPTSPFFALLGQNIVQQGMINAMASATNRFSDSGSGGDSWAGYNWSYGLYLTNPSTSIQGTAINVNFNLSGSVSGGVEVVWVPLSLSFNANTDPDPDVTLGVSVNGNTVTLVTDGMNVFTIVVTPGSSVPDWVLGWLISAIIDAVVSSVTPLITQFLKGISVAGFNIPTYSATVSGKTITLTPNNLQATNVAGYLTMVGQISIT